MYFSMASLSGFDRVVVADTQTLTTLTLVRQVRLSCIVSSVGAGNGEELDVSSPNHVGQLPGSGDFTVRESPCHPLPASLLKAVVQADCESDEFLKFCGFAVGHQLVLQLLI